MTRPEQDRLVKLFEAYKALELWLVEQRNSASYAMLETVDDSERSGVGTSYDLLKIIAGRVTAVNDKWNGLLKK